MDLWGCWDLWTGAWLGIKACWWMPPSPELFLTDPMWGLVA